MSDNGLNVFYTFCLDSNIHHPGLGHRELWNINPKSFMCNINYKFIYYANLPFSYYSQFTVIIFFDNSVAGDIALLCISIA